MLGGDQPGAGHDALDAPGVLAQLGRGDDLVDQAGEHHGGDRRRLPDLGHQRLDRQGGGPEGSAQGLVEPLRVMPPDRAGVGPEHAEGVPPGAPAEVAGVELVEAARGAGAREHGREDGPLVPRQDQRGLEVAQASLRGGRLDQGPGRMPGEAFLDGRGEGLREVFEGGELGGHFLPSRRLASAISTDSTKR